MPPDLVYDVVIVGGGPAGLSAALLLGRSRRRVIVIDSGRQRNLRSHAMHGYLTRDGVSPAEYLRLAREELLPYSVDFRPGEVVQAGCLSGGGFESVLHDGTHYRSRKLLLATGVVDRIPDIEGIDALYGTSVFHCPYCDGWEMRDRRIAVFGRGRSGVGLSLSLTVWSRDIMLFTHGRSRIHESDRNSLGIMRIPVRQQRITRVEARGGQLEAVILESGEGVPRDVIFFTTGQHQHSDLAGRLGCPINPKGTISTDTRQGTPVPGLYVVGDLSRDMQLVIVAAAEGAKAGIAMNMALTREDLNEACRPAVRAGGSPS